MSILKFDDTLQCRKNQNHLTIFAGQFDDILQNKSQKKAFWPWTHCLVAKNHKQNVMTFCNDRGHKNYKEIVAVWKKSLVIFFQTSEVKRDL